jgi:plasmid stability protein
MCQMCEEYEAELRRLGIAMDEKVTVEFGPDELNQLGHRAEAHGHDVSAEIRAIVVETIRHPVETDWVARARAIQEMTPPGSITVDSWKLIRASRDWDH